MSGDEQVGVVSEQVLGVQGTTNSNTTPLSAGDTPAPDGFLLTATDTHHTMDKTHIRSRRALVVLEALSRQGFITQCTLACKLQPSSKIMFITSLIAGNREFLSWATAAEH
ncbi:hypothetical protein NHX12_029066, partial [Muraenolepis orangiensis]